MTTITDTKYYPEPSAPPYDELQTLCPQPPSGPYPFDNSAPSPQLYPQLSSEPYPFDNSVPPLYSEKSEGLQGRKVSFFRKAAHFVKAGSWATAGVVIRLASLLLSVVAVVFSTAAVLAAGTGFGIPLALASLGVATTAGVLAFLTKKIAKKCFKNV